MRGRRAITDGDEDAGSAEVVGDCGGYRECEEGFQESAWSTDVDTQNATRTRDRTQLQFFMVPSN